MIIMDIPRDDPYKNFRSNRKLDRSQLPEPVFDERPKSVELYWKAWELAWEHVLFREDALVPKYIDEAMDPSKIWIWDTCFMALFCRYAPDVFPGLQSLENFYYIMHDGKKAPYKIHHPDNPPLFAWVEWEHFKLTGDKDRLKWLLEDKKYLIKHYDFIENARRMQKYKYANVPLFASRTKYGYTWSGVSSGMDNTPRGNGKYHRILWLDLLAQQALSAENIIHMAQVIGNEELKVKFQEKKKQLKELLNLYYWNERDGTYYDIKRRKPTKQVKKLTPASYWPMLAGVSSQHQADRLRAHIENPKILGGPVPWVTIARTDKDYDLRGHYWRGGVWLPTAYMGIKALEKYGYYKTANETASRLLDVMVDTYENFTPHTIWEAYNPEKPIPSTYKANARYVRPDFCGWSALGPISLLIENVIGIYDISANEGYVRWNLHSDQKHGIKNLKFGSIVADLIYDRGKILTRSNGEFTLHVNGKSLKIKAGKAEYNVEKD